MTIEEMPLSLNLSRFRSAASSEPPTAAERARVDVIQLHVEELALAIEAHVPEGRNKSLALTALEDVQMRANRGVFHDARVDSD